MNQYLFLLPEIILFILSCFLLFLKRRNEIALIAVCFTLGAAFFGYPNTSTEILNGMLYISPFSQTVKLVILCFACIFFVQVVAVRQTHSRHFSVLVLFSLLGMLLSVSSSNLTALYLAVELQSIGLYVLACIKHNSIKSAEAGVKYILLGTFMSAIMIYGLSLIFISSGDLSMNSLFSEVSKMHSIGVLFFIAGLLFKIAAAPFHVWVGDVYEGSPTLSTTFFAIIPKLSIIAVLIIIISHLDPSIPNDPSNFAVLVKNSEYLRHILFISGILSLIFGVFSAFGQNNIKRFIGFASVTHVGYMLLGISTAWNLSLGNSWNACLMNPGFTYLLIYSFTNIGILSVILMLRDKNITALKKLRHSNKMVALTFLMLLLSSAGIPPFAGFFGKAYVIKTLVDTGHILAAMVAMLAGVVSAFYYIRIAKELYLTHSEKHSTETGIKPNRILASIVLLCGLFSTFGFVLLLY